MAEARKFYSRCDFGVTKVGETPVVAGAVEGKVSAKGVTTGTGKDDRKYARFAISMSNQKRNMIYWAGMLGASESDLLINTADNGSDYTTLTVYLSGRDAERAEKHLSAGDVVDVTGFLRFSKKEDKRYITLFANGYKLVRRNEAATATPSTTTPEGTYTPEMVDDDEDVPF